MVQKQTWPQRLRTMKVGVLPADKLEAEFEAMKRDAGDWRTCAVGECTKAAFGFEGPSAMNSFRDLGVRFAVQVRQRKWAAAEKTYQLIDLKAFAAGFDD